MASGEGIPYLYGVIATGRGDTFAIRRPCHTTHVIGVSMIGKVVMRSEVVLYKGNRSRKVDIRGNYGQWYKYGD